MLDNAGYDHERFVLLYPTENHSVVVLLIQVRFRTDDAVNQSAARLAREFGEERTIGDFFPNSQRVFIPNKL